PKPAGKLTYKDQRRLEELDGLIAGAPARTAALEASLADPVLYSRDPAAFQRLSRDLETLRTQMIAAEEEWLVLEERREALEAGR
ncbi:MAG TPA: ABC transporter C-terminal domain-containing protein, partial [Phenylobacterium sp.]|nr:ABC transporter C-terminal domain-containing protein [Phenylobacterium sp.]